MSTLNSMLDSESSTAGDDLISQEERNVRIFATQMLKSRLFLGNYQEKRYVESLQSYRDVVVVSESEKDLKKDLDIVRKRLRDFYTDYWIGITGPNFVGAPRGHCIWGEAQENTTFGLYWYKIKSVRFRRNEIILRIKTVRPMSDNDTAENLTQLQENDITDIFNNISFNAVMENVKNSVLENTLWFFTEVLTAENIKEAFTFISLFLAATAALSMKGLGFLMNFTLRFMHEFSYFVQSATPVMIAVVNMIGKVIGGFYILIAMIWRDSTRPKNVQPYNYARNAIEMPRYRNSYRRPLTITEIND